MAKFSCLSSIFLDSDGQENAVLVPCDLPTLDGGIFGFALHSQLRDIHRGTRFLLFSYIPLPAHLMFFRQLHLPVRDTTKPAFLVCGSEMEFCLAFHFSF